MAVRASRRSVKPDIVGLRVGKTLGPEQQRLSGRLDLITQIIDTVAAVPL
jgi:hypothetical protein